MQTYILAVRDRTITSESADSTLVRTSVGVDQIEMRFYSAEWLDFDLSVALKVGGTLIEQSIEPTAAIDAAWLASCTLAVPDSILQHDGPLAVTVHGTDESDNHIITAKAYPLVIEHEGDTAS